jgi:thymidylate kinase
MMILFFGPDGAGKTTLSKMLKKYFLKKGKHKVRVSWVRGTHMLALLIANFLSKFSNMKGVDNPYFSIKLRKRDKIWQFIEFISLAPLILLRYYLPDKIGYIVIGERCPIDSIVWIMQTTKDPKYFKTIFGKFLLCFSSTANVIFFITAKQEILIKRRLNEKYNSLNVMQFYLYEKMYEILKRSYPKSKVYKLDTSSKSVKRSLYEIITVIGD